MFRFLLAATLGATAAAVPVAALAAPRPVVLELFTSESCSSCPPADALLAEFAAKRPDLLPLAFHVDYWNALSWRDRFSSAAATARQRNYAATLGQGVYTPQLVIDGHLQAVGSDRAAVLAAITQAQANTASGPALRLSEAGGTVKVEIGPGSGRGAVLLIGFDNLHHTNVGSGENGGQRIEEANVVRDFAEFGAWDGHAVAFAAPRPQGERLAVVVQAEDGRILAAALAN